MLRPGSMISSALGGQVLAGGADQRVEVGGDATAARRRRCSARPARRRGRRPGTRRARRRRDGLGERLDGEDLRADVDVQARACAAAGSCSIRRDQPAAAAGASPNFEPAWPVSTLRVGVGRHAGDDADQHVLRAARRDGRLEPVDVVGVVDHDDPSPCSTAIAISSSDFALPCSTSRAGSTPALSARDDLAAAGDVEPEALLGHHPLHRRAGERLRREHDPRARPPRGELAPVLAARARSAASATTSTGVPNSAREHVGPAAADGQHAVLVAARCRPGTAIAPRASVDRNA